MKEELRELEMQQIRAAQKRNEKINNKFENLKRAPLEVISPGGESKYS